MSDLKDDTSIPSTPIEPAKNVYIEAFRAFLPEFKAEIYPDALIYPQLFIAKKFVDSKRFGELETYAVSLLIAHFLVLQSKNDNGGKVQGDDDVQIASKSVGGVSISYTSNASANTSNNSMFDSTSYGRRYLGLVQMFGQGAVAIC